MKTNLILLCTLLVVGSAQAKRSDYDTFNRGTLIEWIEQFRAGLAIAKEKAKNTDAALAASQRKVEEGKAEVVKLQGEIKALDDWAKGQWQRAETEKIRADTEHEKAIRNGHQRDIFVLLLAASLTAAIFTGIWRTLAGILSVTGPWGIALIGGLALLTFGIITVAIRFILNLIT